MADTPPWAGPVPVLLSGAWQTKQYATGLAGGIDETVFDALDDPPATAALITAATFGALPAVGAVGKAYKTTNNGKRYTWNGYSYVEVKHQDGSSYS